MRRFCRRHARANALIWMPSGWACCSARSRRRVADGALAPPVAPSGQENERYWRLAGRRSRARCGRSYARPHDHLRRAQQGADLPDDGRLDVACGHAPDRARVVAQLQGRSRAVKPIKSAPSGIWWLVQSRQWLLTRYTSMCCGPPALLAHAHSRSASQPGFISPCHCAEQLYRRSRRAQHLHSLVGALVAAGGEGDHETFEIAGFGRVIMQLIDQGPASGIVPTKPIVGALRDLAGHPLPLPPDESPGAGAVPYAAPPADHASPTAM